MSFAFPSALPLHVTSSSLRERQSIGSRLPSTNNDWNKRNAAINELATHHVKDGHSEFADDIVDCISQIASTE